MQLRPLNHLAYLVLALVVLTSPHASAQNLFFGTLGQAAGNPNQLFTSDLDGNGLTNILPGPGLPVGVDLDPAIQRVFWTEIAYQALPGRVREASFTGASPSTVVTNPSMQYGLAVDSVNQRIYWQEGLTIRRADYNGSNAMTVATGIHPEAIEVDPLAGKIFWGDRGVGANAPNIGMANLDGSSPQTVLTLGANAYPSGITVDPTTQTIFFSDSTADTISTVPYAGGLPSTIFSNVPEPAGLDLELTTNRLYIVEHGVPGVSWASPTGGPRTRVFTGTGQNRGEMWDIAAVVPEPATATLGLFVGALALRRRRGPAAG